jgi:hypothetical protein
MKIFLSHASESKALVRQLTAALPAHVQRWLDQDQMATGERFPEHIEAGIRNECDFLIAFVDEAALASEWVRREVALGLARQRALQRPFVLPVLLGDVGARLGELGLAADEWLHLDARDHSDAGIAASAAMLQAELFKHSSELVEQLRNADRRSLIDAFASELAEFEQAAYRCTSSMVNSYEAMVAMQPAIDHLQQTLAAYNAVSDRFIPRLPFHRDRLSAAWRDRRSLCNHLARLIDQVEDEVYRGAMFDLREVLEMLHETMVEDEGGRLDSTELARRDARKTELLVTAQAALDRMTRDASAVIGDFTAELE